MKFRCGVYLGGILAIGTVIITGCHGQCSSGTAGPQPLQLYADSGVRRKFFSPQYGIGNYPPNSNCGWKIRAEYGHNVFLTVLDLELETDYSGRCQYDSVSIYDGYVQDYLNRLAKICQPLYHNYYSSGQYMYINFTSNGSKQYRGFVMEYTAVPKSQTTTRWPHWEWTTPPPTTTTSDYYWTYRLNSAALIGGLAGACLFLFVVVALCRYCYSRSVSRNSPRTSPHFTTPTSGTGHAPQRNGVYTIPSDGYSPSVSDMENTNMGYSPYVEPPPSYESLQLENGAPPTEPQAPPSYAEATTGMAKPE